MQGQGGFAIGLILLAVVLFAAITAAIAVSVKPAPTEISETQPRNSISKTTCD